MILDSQNKRSIGDKENVAAVAYKGEDQFSCPIVSCTFRSTKVELGSEESLENGGSDEKQGHESNMLLVVTTDGALMLKPANDFGAPISHELKVSHFLC